MALDSKIKKAVDVAFKKLDSLMVNVTFSNKRSTSFDFVAGTVNCVNTGLTTRGYMQNVESFVEGSSVLKLSLFVRTEGIVFSGYTTVNVDGTEYSCSVMDSNKFVTTLNLTMATNV